MRTFWAFSFIGAACATVVLIPPASGQEITASVVGTVVDATGAGVPGATVRLHNTDRNIVAREVQTDSAGDYSATLLPIGQYSVTVEAKGFKKFTTSGLTLNVNDKATVNAKLEVGEVTEQITVQADALEVELQTAASASLISGTQVRELQLNNRNFLQLLTLSPGVSINNNNDANYIGISTPSGSVATIPVSINGARTSQSNWTVDGADILDRGSNLTLFNYPSVDAIAEFRVIRGEYSAEFGRASTGQVNVITRSGTNEFHGGAYEFFRNDKLQANNYFNNLNSVAKPALRYNNFGYTIGGPVIIPKVYKGKDRTFFFFSEEWRRQLAYQGVNAFVPTADQKRGLFSSPVCIAFNANSTCAATGTQIPAASISPTASAYLKDVYANVPDAPADNVPIYTLFHNQYFFRQELARVDHIFGPKLAVAVRFIHDSIPTVEAGGLFTNSAIPGVAVTSTNSPGKGWVVRATSALSPTWSNEAGYAYSAGGIFSTPTGSINAVLSPDIRPKLPFASTTGRIPSVSFGGNFDSIAGFGPYDDASTNHNIFDNMTKVAGRHTVKFGFSFNIYQKHENQITNNTGSYSISSAGAPDSGTQTLIRQTWANFLLGRVDTFTQSSVDLVPELHAKQFEFYGQDDFRVRRNLTLNLGLRYGLYRQPYEATNLSTNFDTALFDPAKAPKVDPVTGNLVPNTGDPLNGIIRAGQNSPWGDNVNNQTYKAFAPRVGLSWDPFGTGKTAIRSGYGLAYDVITVGIWQDSIGSNPPYAAKVTLNSTNLDNPAGGTSPPAAPPNISTTPIPYHAPYVQQWSFDIQREFAGTIFQVGYYGAHGTHLIGLIDINTLRAGQLIAAGLLPSGSALSSSQANLINAQRPYQGYAQINAIETAFDSSYNSLQASVQKRFAGRSLLGLAYTWAKVITNAQTDRSSGFADGYNTRLDRNEANFSRHHVLNINAVYDLPSLSTANGWIKTVFGSWEFAAIANFDTGLPLTVTTSSARDPAGLGLTRDSFGTSSRPDRVGDPDNIGDRTRLQWFNTAAFAVVPNGVIRPGNSPRGALFGPGFYRFDLALYKNFRIKERATLQVRGESFNALNHTNLATLGTTLGTSTFGRVLSARDPRIYQLGMKLNF